MGSSGNTERRRQGSAIPGARSDKRQPSIPFRKDDKEYYPFYERLQQVVAARANTPRATPRIVVITDIEQDYDDLLAIIFLAEMHRMGAVELAGFIANHEPALKRAMFLRTVLHLLQLPNIPVAVGTSGAEDPAKHVSDSYYSLRNETFEKAPWNAEPFYRGDKLIEQLADPSRPLTMLLISSLQDMGEFFTKHEKNPEFITQTFSKFVSQGGYEVDRDRQGNPVLTPTKKMMNNDFHPVR
jgi:hypothetical protein